MQSFRLHGNILPDSCTLRKCAGQAQSPHARESKEGGRGKGGRGAARTELMARGAEVRAENKAAEDLKNTEAQRGFYPKTDFKGRDRGA